jgi:hypothetical protein
LRARAKRQGLVLRKSRYRNPDLYEYGGYMIVDADNNSIVAGGAPHAYSLSLDGVEAFLRDE